MYIYIFYIYIYFPKHLNWHCGLFERSIYLPETNSQRTRKWDGWNTIVSFRDLAFSQMRTVSFRMVIYAVHIIPYESMFVCWSRLFVCYLETFLDCHLGRWLFETHWLIWTFPVNKYTSLGKFETMTFVICLTPQSWWRWFVCFSYLTLFFQIWWQHKKHWIVYNIFSSSFITLIPSLLHSFIPTCAQASQVRR